MRTTLVSLCLIAVAGSAVAEVQEQAHFSLQGLPSAGAPQVLRDHSGKSPDLTRQGTPKTIASAPERRQQEYSSALNFDEPSQCYNVAKNLVSDDNFVVEAWVFASQENDAGWHAAVANGNGGSGFLIAQKDDQWAVLVGGIGVAILGEVEPERWTHLAIVKSQGTVTGWLNGKRVCNVPNLGGGMANFSIGATAPGREAFHGYVAEVRYATFQPGRFDAARDFLGNPTPVRRTIVPSGPEPPPAAHPLQTEYATFGFDDQGFLLSITSRQTGKQYCPGKHPSPVMSLHDNGQPNDKLVLPVAARFATDKSEIELKYPNGATAVVKAEAKSGYLRFQLVSLTPRGTVDNIVWGPVHTKIAGKIGDLLGVVRDDDWAIGLYGLDDNTISGPVMDGDSYTMGYFIHSPDPAEVPLPRKFKEGQFFNIGGNGKDDTAYFSRPEEYFQYICGTGAKLEPEFGSSVAYHSRDRRRSYVYTWSLLGGGFEAYRPRKLVSDPLPGVDFIGSCVALYACPDDLGLTVLEKITLAEGLPYVTDRDGVWVRNPASYHATVYWNGPVDKAIEYTKALGLKDISRDTSGQYPSLDKKWQGGVSFRDGRAMSYQEFGELAHKAGLTHGGLHELCMFLQGGISHEVTPVPSEHLQTVCRTKLARDISATDTEIVVTDPAFLAEKGTWQVGDSSNYLRIGGEMLYYDGISSVAPWTLTGVKRGRSSKATPHKAGDELVKLMQNCYNGFAPDMTLLLQYADYYADLLVRNNMDIIDFDGFESTMYQHHGYYATRVFCRRLFEAYHQRTGGKWPRVTSSNVFPGSWEYLNVCNIGGGSHMFDPVTGRRAIQGKDIGNGWTSSWFPATFGKQDWNSAWSLYDAENLEAKAVGWDATYALLMSESGIDRTGERDAIFKAFRAWQNARGLQAFSKAQKRKLRDPDYKFHLEQTGPRSFVLSPIQEFRLSGNNVSVFNQHESQPLQFALRIHAPTEHCIITLPGGGQIKSEQKIAQAHYILCRGSEVYVANELRKKIADLPLLSPTTLPAGESKLRVEFPGTKAPTEWTVWIAGEKEEIGR
jgi:hypothetical protein